MTKTWGGEQFDRDTWTNVCAVIDELESKQKSAMAALMERERFIDEQLKTKKRKEEAND